MKTTEYNDPENLRQKYSCEVCSDAAAVIVWDFTRRPRFNERNVIVGELLRHDGVHFFCENHARDSIITDV
jgi:hypothetical protein